MIASGYSMDLYCRHLDIEAGVVKDAHGHRYDEFPHQFFGETWGECKRKAMGRGWVFGRDGDVTCPRCSGKKRKPLPPEPPTVSIWEAAAAAGKAEFDPAAARKALEGTDAPTV